MKPAAALALVALAFTACQDADKSYDAVHGPENVLQAPLFSEENRQQDATNRQLMEMSKEDSLFFVKKEKAAATEASDKGTAPIAKADTSKAAATTPTGEHTEHAAEEHAPAPH